MAPRILETHSRSKITRRPTDDLHVAIVLRPPNHLQCRSGGSEPPPREGDFSCDAMRCCLTPTTQPPLRSAPPTIVVPQSFGRCLSQCFALCVFGTLFVYVHRVCFFSRGAGHALLLHPRAPGRLRREMVPRHNGRDDLQAVGAEDRAERRKSARGKASGEKSTAVDRYSRSGTFVPVVNLFALGSGRSVVRSVGRFGHLERGHYVLAPC